MSVNVASFSGLGIKFPTGGGNSTYITPNKLREIRSKIRTHEGETLTGRKGRAYMDKYSRQYLGKDLERSYMDQKIRGHI